MVEIYIYHKLFSVLPRLLRHEYLQYVICNSAHPSTIRVVHLHDSLLLTYFLVLCLKLLLLNVLLSLSVCAAVKAAQRVHIRLELLSDHKYLFFKFFKWLLPTIPVLFLLCMCSSNYACTVPTVSVLCMLCLCYFYSVCTMHAISV